MTSMCCDIKYAEQDDDTLINAFDGNEDEAHEFILQFSDLEYDIDGIVFLCSPELKEVKRAWTSTDAIF